MNAGEAPANVADSQRRESRLVPGLVWFILISTGWVLFELTANPALSAVVACLKFGWNDSLTARWMRRTDPNRARGGTYFWFLLGNAPGE